MKKTIKTTPTDSGRSMVEMLGVLAIIGVLSIGGIAGYTMAMNRHKANQIVDLASKLSVLAQTQYAADPDNWDGVYPESLKELGLDDYGYGSGAIETTFWEEENGDVFVVVNNPGVANALKSVTGRDDGYVIKTDK